MMTATDRTLADLGYGRMFTEFAACAGAAVRVRDVLADETGEIPTLMVARHRRTGLWAMTDPAENPAAVVDPEWILRVDVGPDGITRRVDGGTFYYMPGEYAWYVTYPPAAWLGRMETAMLEPHEYGWRVTWYALKGGVPH